MLCNFCACSSRRRDNGRSHRSISGGKFGFTLIEVLVVVAIIALLISILLPSLHAAREQARITVCQTSMKQVGTMNASYQAEYRGFVPIVFNDATVNSPSLNYAAENTWVSVALRKYSAQTSNLAGRTVEYEGATYKLDPTKYWTPTMRDAYELKVMPDFWACPFQRGKGARNFTWRDEGFFRIYDKKGRFDSIQTWMWEDVVRNSRPAGEPAWPNNSNPSIGVAKYTAFSWNRVKVSSPATFTDGTSVPSIPNSYNYTDSKVKTAYRQWTTGDLRRLRSGSFSLSTIAYCAAGESVLAGQPNGRVGWANPGSHRKSGTGTEGGTDVIFADTHVEWVMGKQVGWY